MKNWLWRRKTWGWEDKMLRDWGTDDFLPRPLSPSLPLSLSVLLMSSVPPEDQGRRCSSPAQGQWKPPGVRLSPAPLEPLELLLMKCDRKQVCVCVCDCVCVCTTVYSSTYIKTHSRFWLTAASISTFKWFFFIYFWNGFVYVCLCNSNWPHGAV